MNQYVMLGRFAPRQKGGHRMDRSSVIRQIYERTVSVPETRINHVRLTLGRFDVVINVEAESNNAAYDLSSEIQEATGLSIETLAVASEDWHYPPPPPEDYGDGGDPAGVREPSEPGPEAGAEPAYAERRQNPFNTVADAMNAPEPGQHRRPRRQ